jgi:hypothetical protein
MLIYLRRILKSFFFIFLSIGLNHDEILMVFEVKI